MSSQFREAFKATFRLATANEHVRRILIENTTVNSSIFYPKSRERANSDYIEGLTAVENENTPIGMDLNGYGTVSGNNLDTVGEEHSTTTVEKDAAEECPVVVSFGSLLVESPGRDSNESETFL